MNTASRKKDPVNRILLLISGVMLVVLTGLLTSFHSGPEKSPKDEYAEEQIEFDDFQLIEGLEIRYVIEHRKPRLRLMQLNEGARRGIAEDYFFEPTGRYDITVCYVDGTGGESSLEVFVNDRRAGNIVFGATDSPAEKTISGVNVQEWSKIRLVFSGDGSEQCRVYKLVFAPAGEFDGVPEGLEKPKIPQLFGTDKEKLEGRRMFTRFVGERVDKLMAERLSELSELKTPAEWRARQKVTRGRLGEFFGEFPEKTPLNPRITGTLDREGYTIEKVIFESQPGYYITGNLYVPKGREFPVPGIVFTCGHALEGKTSGLYHEACLGLVLKGYVVLSFDPIGQGERWEYIHSKTAKNLFPSAGDQHMYVAWPSFFVDWSLAGTRVWDGIRTVDYLLSRPEVDQTRLGVVGNSGGGQMSFLIAAVDERVDVCVAAHPGGGDENMYLKGWGLGTQALIDREILSLIAPRPCRIVVGDQSGEIPVHRPKYEDMLLFYRGLGSEDKLEFTVVDGVHNMRQPKREASYEWFNKWFDKQREGKAEPGLQPENQKNLLCTESGSSLISLNSETAQTLNAKRLERIYHPAKNNRTLKKEIASRLGLDMPGNEQQPLIDLREKFTIENIEIEKFTYESEPGIMIPSVLYKPQNSDPGTPVYLCVSGKGKPRRFDSSNLPFLLAEDGSIVLAIDVRGTGETSPTPLVVLDESEFSEDSPPVPKHHYILRNSHYITANQCLSFGRTVLGMRTLDVLMGIRFISSRDDLKGRSIILVGEGYGGHLAILAAAFDTGVDGVATLGTVPSYKLFVTNKYYNIWEYFWVPGLLRDFDIPDLARLLGRRPQVWINPLNATGAWFDQEGALQILGASDNIHILTNADTPGKDTVQIFREYFESGN